MKSYNLFLVKDYFNNSIYLTFVANYNKLQVFNSNII